MPVTQAQQIPLFDLIMCLSDAVDLVSPAVVNHHKQVAYMAYTIGSEMGLPLADRKDLVVAGSLHDVGALSLRERLDILRFEIEGPARHAEIGYGLLKMVPLFAEAARLVRFHHLPWKHGAGAESMGVPVPTGSHVLHLADRVAVLIDREQDVLAQAESISSRVEALAGEMFVPEMVEAIKGLASKEYFWLDATYPSIETVLSRKVDMGSVGMGVDDFLGLARLFSRIIDFRSRFTATHSSGVVATAETLARLAGSTEQERQTVMIAGYLHDLGKLAVPSEILEKPARLSDKEFNMMRRHTFYTYRILDRIGALELVKICASFHHERLEGSGYPFHLDERNLPMICRILAVADVFTAITEDRPYRKGMAKEQALQLLQGMADASALEPSLVSLMRVHFDEINAVRIAAQAVSEQEYRDLALGTA